MQVGSLGEVAEPRTKGAVPHRIAERLSGGRIKTCLFLPSLRRVYFYVRSTGFISTLGIYFYLSSVGSISIFAPQDLFLP